MPWVCIMNNKKADMGIGTLIIFIAMVLVAAVAASVLLATTSKLQNKALDTGKLTTTEVGTGLQAVELYAEDGTDQDLDYWYETIKLSAGSDAVRFTDILITMSLSNTAKDFIYNSGMNCRSMVSYTSSDGFGVEYQINGTVHNNGYLNKGDISKVCFASPRAVNESEEIQISVIPKNGPTLRIDTTTPDLMVDTRVDIFP